MINNYGSHDLSNINEKIFSNIKNKNIITNGDYCKLFEKKISKVVNSKYSVVCNNGTSAIMMAILALNLRFSCHHSQYKFCSFSKYNKFIKR